MLNIELKSISYTSASLEIEVKHYVLIADYKNKKILLSVPNLYLYERTRSSLQTSRRYALIISMFYRFLATRKAYKHLAPGDYHAVVQNKDIRHWQIHRQENRVKNNSSSPTSETIFEDAKIALNFFAWVQKSGFTTNIKIELEDWIANFKNSNLLNYIKRKAGVRISSDPIRALDREASQKKPHSLITNQEIKTLLGIYPDKVYSVIFLFGLATAMRPMEISVFPLYGNGKNKHILPYSSMPEDTNKFTYTVLGKGNKLRDIVIPAYALKDLEENYIKTEYTARKKKYKEKFGTPCPPSILFLNSEGDPVTERMISNATYYACKLAHKSDPAFRTNNNFYQARHWWPTMMMIQHRGAQLLSPAADVLDAAFGQVLTAQLGHEDISTTYKHYLDLARVLIMARDGRVNDIISEDFNIHVQIAEYG
ncbi:hypothetical protein [Pseudomonas sp. PD9R]|uniref:hypothetical protein n=1 Tax=Pseudomonas sp. PD9R TaxID=2853534 RepID=UPI001C47B08C|nr:hypothetical protein [Pseudomonas sp. PD9R]MBV6825706.1 hypothetical protein [Pseudomonas sp. PD9R]